HSVAEPRFDVVVWHDPVEPDAGKRRGGLPPRVGVAVTGSGSDRNARGGLRLAMIGAGWITQIHLEALDRLGRTTLVGVAATREESVRALATPRGAEAYTDIDRMLDEQRPDAAYVAVPPSEAVAMLDRLLERRIPFLTEKPLAATDRAGPERIAALVAERGVVAAVGYHLRALDALAEVRALLASNPAHLAIARWLSDTPGPAWWRREASGGGQVVEQATHFYDLARFLVGEATVVGAASTRSDPVVPADADVVDATAAVLRFSTGAVGSFANTRRLGSAVVAIELAASDLLIRIRRAGDAPGGWAVDFEDDDGVRTIPPGRDPYEAQAEVFVDAVEAGEPDRVLSTYGDALETDRLTRAVVAATGHGG
ncbi:MAG TPA: Gfo/Idh/MocA family oxidoreductase, partial [Candidatus Acidoferrum sp.]|nr:Gfo/Idh/MocA family oxidoreductase [Candidatus Acidoferrum sp.]